MSTKGSFKNHVDNRGWVGGHKFVIFVHFYYIRNVHGGRWVVKKSKIMSMWLLNAPNVNMTTTVLILPTLIISNLRK